MAQLAYTQVWAESTDESEYAALVWRITRSVMDGVDDDHIPKISWKHGDEVGVYMQGCVRANVIISSFPSALNFPCSTY